MVKSEKRKISNSLNPVICPEKYMKVTRVVEYKREAFMAFQEIKIGDPKTTY